MTEILQPLAVAPSQDAGRSPKIKDFAGKKGLGRKAMVNFQTKLPQHHRACSLKQRPAAKAATLQAVQASPTCSELYFGLSRD